MNAADFVPGRGLVDAPRLVSRKGVVVRKLDKNPFARARPAGGGAADDERQPECDPKPGNLAELEAVMEKL